MMLCVMDDVVCSQVHSLLVEGKVMSLAVILLPSVFLLKFWVVAKGPISPVTSQIRSWHV